MKTLQKSLVVVAVIVVISGLVVSYVGAMTPSLSVNTINNDVIRITVNGDAYASVSLSYLPPNSSNWSTTASLGTTNSNGYFSTTISSYSYGIPSGSSVYATVNNQQSSTTNWPYFTSGYYNNSLVLTRTSVELYQGQSTTVSSLQGSLYVSSNSNTNIVNAYANGNMVTLTANGSQGSATVTVCSEINGTQCVPIYVDVNSNQSSHPYNNPWITLGAQNVTITTGQTYTVNMYGSGSYYLSNNSNNNVASASVNGNTFTIQGINQGTTLITACATSSNSSYSNPCSTITVNVQQATVSSTNANTPTTVYLSQVPYTGASDMNVIIFTLALGAWTAGLSYYLVRRKVINRT